MGLSWTPSDDGFLATYAPDDLLLREDDLAEQLGVSRTSIREAVKVLSAKGLLQARRRVGVRVRDQDDWNLLGPWVSPGIRTSGATKR
jgi:DNA-binding FadR family transcriptional regulator